MLTNRLLREWIIVLALACGFAGWALSSGLTERLDLQLQDRAVGMLADDPDPSILIVAIDDRSLAQVGPWPWPRSQQAQLIERLDAAGSRAILMDILLIEATDPQEDQQLADAIGNAGNVVLPFTFEPELNTVDGVVPLRPLPLLGNAAHSQGHVGIQFDTDGAVRFMKLTEGAGEQTYPQAMLTLYRLAYNPQTADPAWSDPEAEPVLFPFRPQAEFPTVSASDLLAGSVPQALLQDRVVLIGATAQGLRDQYPVPASADSIQNGVAINANLLDAMHAGTLVSPIPFIAALVLTQLAVLVQFLAFWFLHPRNNLLFAVIFWVGLLVVSVFVPLALHVWISPVPAVAAMILSYPLWAWRRLSAVVDYLEREASSLSAIADLTTRPVDRAADEVGKQVDRFRSLVSAVRERFDFVRTVVRAAPEPMMVFDTEGNAVTMNANARELFEDVAQDVDFDTLIESIGGTMSQDGEEFTLETQDRTFRVSHAPFEEAGAGELGKIVQLHEITQIRRAERQRREMLEFLSHDMRSPQVAILQLAREKKLPYSNEERFSLIEADAKRTLDLADNFVGLARLEQQELTLQQSDLVCLAQDAIDRAYVLAQSKNIEVSIRAKENVTYVLCEPALIARLLDNLLSNAIKYCPEGSQVVASVSDDPDAPANAVLEITDNGPGMPKERLANPFARFGSRSTGHGPSAGLGLSFVADVVKKHHGRIEVISEEGAGTTFKMWLPLA